jgi:glycosidase
MFSRDMNRAKVAATLLLTLPGLPFVYYGEEIGMVGDKPDERIRTPMQWAPRRGLGFTAGTPWQAAQPDSFTTTVEAQEADSSSLLVLYRRLIHLRKGNNALASGELLQLTSSHPGVAAYVRRAGNSAVLVVVNLSGAAADSVALTSTASVLSSGSYDARNLLGGPGGAALQVAADGQLRAYQPLSRALNPGESLVLELTAR